MSSRVVEQLAFWLQHPTGGKLDKSRFKFSLNYKLNDIYKSLKGLMRIFFSCPVKSKVDYLIVGKKFLNGFEKYPLDPYLGNFVNDAAKNYKTVFIGNTSKTYSNNVIELGRYSYDLIRAIVYLLAIPFTIIKAFQMAKHIRKSHQTKRSLISICLRYARTTSDNFVAEILIHILQPKYLVLIDFYNSNSSFILAAKKLTKKCTIYEVQHGIISLAHFGYSNKSNYKEIPRSYDRLGRCLGKQLTQSFRRSVSILKASMNISMQALRELAPK